MKLLNTLIWFVIGLSSAIVQAAPVTLSIHTDALGSPIAATDQKGDVVWKEEYRPFGERIIKDNKADSQKRWFTGHVQDKDTGLVYMGARFYDPSIGRFLTPDPVGFSPNAPMMFNRYAYANNNPYKYTDPDGRSPENLFISDYSAYQELRGAQLGIDSSTKAGALSIAKIDQREAAMELVGAGIGAGVGKLAGAFSRITRSGDTRVGRWMSSDELANMKKTGQVQEGSGGMTFVANSGPSSFSKQAKPGSNYVEFDVPSNSLLQGGKTDWLKTLGSNAPKSQLFKLNKQGGEVNPPFRNLSDVIETK
ncbi:RHS repeat domain-containing protein [Alkalimarinus coralli]|uniref:RHS repeat domain-containing protein n=1 Tax=Alkalimarinus coralli TaxID=2935863 RepID=UPI00202B673B|nr:RHS repeat-associated core domain-containing protein [Alkalimarinus coralli]